MMVTFTCYLWAWLTHKRSDLQNKRKHCNNAGKIMGTTTKKKQMFFRYLKSKEMFHLPLITSFFSLLKKYWVLLSPYIVIYLIFQLPLFLYFQFSMHTPRLAQWIIRNAVLHYSTYVRPLPLAMLSLSTSLRSTLFLFFSNVKCRFIYICVWFTFSYF